MLRGAALVAQTARGHGDSINDIAVHPLRPSLVLTASRVRTDLALISVTARSLTLIARTSALLNMVSHLWPCH